MRDLTGDLIAVLEGDGRFSVGDGVGGEHVDGVLVKFSPPFLVVYPLVQQRDGSFADGYSDVRKFFELVCEGVDRRQSEWVADNAELAIARSSLVVASMTRARTDRDDTTGSPSRHKTWVRVELLAHSPTGV